MERDILARFVPFRASSMGPTIFYSPWQIMLGKDCLHLLELSTARIEGVAEFLAEGSPSPSECGGMVSGGV